MPKRTYTPQERTQALELYAEEGPTAVEDQLGIPKGTVMGWARTDGVRTRAIENATARVQAQNLKWEERRIELAHDFGRVGALALARAERELRADDPGRDIQALLTSAAICVDKAQLLTGSVTDRHEHRHIDAVDAAIVELADQLEHQV